MPRSRRASSALFLCAVVLACNGLTMPIPPEGGKRVLFVGNSLTYTGNLPRVIAELARSIDETPLVYRVVAEPDYSLEDHYYAGVTSAIEKDNWEYVVMQQGPSSLPANQEYLRYWTTILDGYTTLAGARSALYQVWPAVQYRGSFTAVRDSYRNAAIAVNGMFIPAGEAWVKAWEADPDLALYGPDGFHPSLTGVYLTALVHFEMLYGRPATDLPKKAVVYGQPLNLSSAKIALLQQAAHETAVAWGIP